MCVGGLIGSIGYSDVNTHKQAHSIQVGKMRIDTSATESMYLHCLLLFIISQELAIGC